MFCPYCGKKISDKGIFCVYCGEKLKDLFDGESAEILKDNLEDIELDNEMEEVNRLGEDITSEQPANLQTQEHSPYNSQYIVVDINDPEIPLLNGEKLDGFKKDYLKGNEFVFTLGNHEIRYYEDVVMDINTCHYLIVSGLKLWQEFETEYKARVNGMATFFSIGIPLYDLHIRKMLTQVAKLLVGTGIMKYSEMNLRQYIPVYDDLKATLRDLRDDCQKLLYEAAQRDANIELGHMQSNSLFIGGGRGFAGAFGGMAAVGAANMAADALGSIKASISKSSNKAELQRRLDMLYTQDWILNSFSRDWGCVGRDCLELYTKIYMEECNAIYHVYADEDNIESILQNTVSSLTDKKLILKNIAYLLSVASPIETFGEEMKCVIDNFLDDEKIIKETLVLADFFLIKGEIERYLEEKKKFIMEPYLNLSENDSDAVHKKIEEIKNKCVQIRYDATEELKRLKEKETELKKEEAFQAERMADIRQRMKTNLEDAERIRNALEEGYMQTVTEMAMNGSMVAEERYIQYYIQRIRDEDNTQLFDAIAKECGKSRVYDCIIAVCCHKGYGTIRNLDVTKGLLVNSAEQGCTYAMGYIHHLVIQKNADFLDKENAEDFSEDAIEELSPYAYYWEGKKFCQGSAEGGSNEIANNYEKAVKCIGYAAACGIEGSEKMLEYLSLKSADEINNMQYGKNSSGCYITTAVCESFGKPDDCYELTAFRKFRDTYLIHTLEGKQLIRQYYITAPRIVEAINRKMDKEKIYLNIWNKYLLPCLTCIENKEYLECKSRYITMVNQLQEEYLRN